MIKNNKLFCHTAIHKLKEAKYFFERLKTTEVWNDDESFDFNLNAFVFSANSVLDYVHADFMYHGFTHDQRIKWYMFEQRENRNEIIENHSERIAIEKFRSKYSNEIDKFLRNSLANYFRQKRNKISHIHWDAARWTAFTEKENIKIIYERKFEGFSSDYYLKTRGCIPLDLFDNTVDEEEKIKTLDYLCRTDLREICDQYLSLLEEFINKFHGTEFPIKTRKQLDV